MSYEARVTRVLQGGTNDEIFEWCFSVGRQLSDEDIAIWSEDFKMDGGGMDRMQGNATTTICARLHCFTAFTVEVAAVCVNIGLLKL